MPQALTDAWFAEADWDGDGRLTGAEAKAFFGRTGLPVDSLSKVPSGWLVFSWTVQRSRPGRLGCVQEP